MKDVLDDVERWLDQGHAVALATVISTMGSSPREPGTVMAVNDAGEVAGSISGGCVEGAVVDEALNAIANHQPRLVSYGITDELGLSVGLTCGGMIQVFVAPLDETDLNQVSWKTLSAAVRAADSQPVAVCTMVEGPQPGLKLLVTDNHTPIQGSLGNPELDRVVVRDARGLLAPGFTDLRHYGRNGERRETDIAILIQSFAAPPQMIIFGAVDFTRSLCKLAKMVGYRVIVCDARSRFATRSRFPEADEVLVEWPHRYLERTAIDSRTAIALLTHDPKFDVPALISAVRSPAGYIGAMGSRKAHADRLERLKEAGLSETELARINSPIGLDIGARTTEETAVSIMAEVIALKNGRRGERLSESQNPIHAKK